MVKNPVANARGIGHPVLIPGLGSFPAGGSDNTLQYPWLENPMERVAWQATVQGSHKVRHTELDMTEANKHAIVIKPKEVLA